MPKGPEKLERQMKARGWTHDQIAEAISAGAQFPAMNLETGGPATRYIYPITGRSVVVDDETQEVIHVGGDGFVY